MRGTYLLVGNSARVQLVLAQRMVWCPIPIARPQAAQERQPAQEAHL